MSLRTYRAKRRFDVTPEPRGADRPRRSPRKSRRFVVHKHRASHLHYDLRLESDGVLLSWAVPKGPSLDPSVKRLAMMTEDHPVEYEGFEGTIPEQEYGGGTMMLWDRGTWTPDEPDVPVRRSVARGELKFTLNGEKLRGSFVLVRTGGRDGRSWLLIKHRDDAASDEDVTETKPYSVATGRLLAQIAHDEGGDVAKAASGDPPAAVERLLGELRAAKPAAAAARKGAAPKSKRSATRARKDGARATSSRAGKAAAAATPRAAKPTAGVKRKRTTAARPRKAS